MTREADRIQDDARFGLDKRVSVLDPDRAVEPSLGERLQECTRSTRAESMPTPDCGNVHGISCARFGAAILSKTRLAQAAQGSGACCPCRGRADLRAKRERITANGSIDCQKKWLGSRLTAIIWSTLGDA